jgi:hypothetical protein
MVADFVARHPEHAREITDFAAEWWLLDAHPELERERASEGDPAMVVRAMKLMEAQLDKLEAATALTDPFAEQSPTALKALAGRLGLDTTLIAKFKHRLIRVESVPRQLLTGLARELDVALDVVTEWLNAPPRLQGAHFKAKDKPETGRKESFVEALEHSTLDPERRNRWLMDP